MSHAQYQSSPRFPRSLWPASLSQQFLQIQSRQTLSKSISDTHRTSLDFMKETQKYIKSMQNQEIQGKTKKNLAGMRMRYREVRFPGQEIPDSTRKWPIKTKAVHEQKSLSGLDTSSFLNSPQPKPSFNHSLSNYAVTRYMLVKPMSPRANLGFPSRTQVNPLQEPLPFVNQKIESFLNRFDRKKTRISLPGIALKID